MITCGHWNIGLQAWSNGRMHPVKHRVMMRGEKERISLGIFPVPTEGTIIKPPKELIDEEHPQIFKEFDFMEFLSSFLQRKECPLTQQSKFLHLLEFALEDTLRLFAGCICNLFLAAVQN